MVKRQKLVPQPQLVEPVIQAQPEAILENRNHNADDVVRKVQQKNIRANNNIANLVKTIMAQNGLSSQSLMVIPVNLLLNTSHVFLLRLET